MLTLTLLLACASDPVSTPKDTSTGVGGDDTGTPATDDSEPSAGTDDSTAPTDDSATPPEDTSPPEDTGEPPEPEEQIVRFIAMGDGGEGNDDQYNTAAAVKALCEAKQDDRAGCDFVLYLGDNFYDDGVESVDDEQFQTKFELPYADLDLPFYVVLGNHDYGETSLLQYKSQYEVEYTDYSDKWNMPDEFYSFTAEHVNFIGLDTNAIMLESIWGDSGQADWIQDLYAKSTSDWHIAYGHHPYVSNGKHGNAGEYEGISWLPIVNGESVEDFMDDNLCGQVDLYLCGHDHNRQWLDPQCGTEFIVSGAAAKTSDLEDRGTATLFEDDSLEGFVWIEIRDNVLTGEFYNMNGTMEFDRTLSK